MSHLLDFYRLHEPDSEGRMLSDLWGWSTEQLELVHDFIQWMFPLDEPSAFNPDAPLVTEADRQAFRDDPQLQEALRRSFTVFLHFLGLQQNPDGTVTTASHFEDRSGLWKYSNHNWLRITRVLKSLRLLGLEAQARALFACLQHLHVDKGLVSERSYDFWHEAMS
jgi:hypothetical protein